MDFLGDSVAISGNTAIVGAWKDDDNGNDSGSAYLFNTGDCNGNGVVDSHDIFVDLSEDCDGNLVPDECEVSDCDADGAPDNCEIAAGTEQDCNGNGVPDWCDVAYFTSQDCNLDLVPDDCQLLDNDCNTDLVPDDCQITGNDCNLDMVPDDCQLTDNDVNTNGVPDDCECLSNWFCSTTPNSVGPGMLINYEGHLSVSVNTLTLTASGGPVNQPGLFYYGPGQVNGGNGIPFGNGLRCVSAGGVGVFRIQDPTSGNAYAFMDSNGNTTKPFDMTYGPMGSGPGQIQPGDTWNFQFWYRDPTVGPPPHNFNLSDAMGLTFCP